MSWEDSLRNRFEEAEVAPPASVWPRIEARIATAPAKSVWGWYAIEGLAAVGLLALFLWGAGQKQLPNASLRTDFAAAPRHEMYSPKTASISSQPNTTTQPRMGSAIETISPSNKPVHNARRVATKQPEKPSKPLLTPTNMASGLAEATNSKGDTASQTALSENVAPSLVMQGAPTENKAANMPIFSEKEAAPTTKRSLMLVSPMSLVANTALSASLRNPTVRFPKRKRILHDQIQWRAGLSVMPYNQFAPIIDTDESTLAQKRNDLASFIPPSNAMGTPVTYYQIPQKGIAYAATFEYRFANVIGIEAGLLYSTARKSKPDVLPVAYSAPELENVPASDKLVLGNFNELSLPATSSGVPPIIKQISYTTIRVPVMINLYFTYKRSSLVLSGGGGLGYTKSSLPLPGRYTLAIRGQLSYEYDLTSHLSFRTGPLLDIPFASASRTPTLPYIGIQSGLMYQW